MTKKNIIKKKKKWIPSDNHKFPACTKRNSKFRRSWLLEFPLKVVMDGALSFLQGFFLVLMWEKKIMC